MPKTKKTAGFLWKQVDVQGNLHVASLGDRAARVEKDGGQYEVKIGRRRKGPPRHWTWEPVGRYSTVEGGKAAAEIKLPGSR